MDSYVFEVSNLHCSSCETSVKEALAPVIPPSWQVFVSVAEGKVTLVPDEGKLDSKGIRRVVDRLLASGYDVEDMNVDEIVAKPGWFRQFKSALFDGGQKEKRHKKHCESCRDEKHKESEDSDEAPTIIGENSPATATEFKTTFAIGGMSCVSCSNQITETVKAQFPSLDTFAVDLMNKSAVVIINNKTTATKIQECIRGMGYMCDLVEMAPVKSTKAYKVTASIGGMTCAACVNQIVAAVQDIEGVDCVTVSLMSNSADIIIADKKWLPKVVEAIEDSGYDCDIHAVEDTESKRVEEMTRTVNLAIDGMFCDHCPDNINNALSSYGQAMVVDDPVALDHPFVKFTYKPELPNVTIRHIIRKVQDLSPQFTLSIVHPMTLEERSAKLQKHEQVRLFFRLALSVAVAIPTFILGIVGMSLLKKDHPFRMYIDESAWAGSASRVTWALLILATPIYFFAADVFHIKAVKEIRNLWRPGVSWKRRFFKFGSMDMLMSLGVNVSYWTSLALLILAAKSPNREEHGKGDEEMGYHTTFFDSVVFLTMFLLIGRCLEAYSKARAASAISLLSDLRPKEAILVFAEDGALAKEKVDFEEGKMESDEEEEEHTTYSGDDKVSVDYLEIGDYIRVLPGMTPPTDCIVVQGGSTFDESALTGESRPVRHGQGDQIFAGTVNNGSGSLIAKVMALEGGSLLDQIVNVVREGQLHRAPIERVADRLTSVFVPIVTSLAIITWIIWLALGTTGSLPPHYLDIDLGGWVVWSLQFAISVFVVACPCGIGLAAPTALFVGTGLAAKYGILARGGGEAFQEGAKVDVVCFDKTGTLTEGGEPKITDEKVISYDTKEIFFLAKLIEQQSGHPLAVAVVNHVTDMNIELPGYSVTVEEVPGKGLKGSLSVPKTSSLGQAGVTEFLFGNERLIEENNAAISNEDAALLHRWKTEGKSVMLMALRPDGGNFALALIISAEDKIRPETPSVLKALQEQNIQTWMISGDNQITANAVAARIGIPADNVIGGVLPQEKAAKVQWLQKTAVSARSGKSTGRAIVAMVGDGVNDAPSLSTADVGIAIGSGADIAMSSAKFVLMRSELTSVLTLFDLSRAIFRRIKLNFAWALVYNCIGIPVAAGVIYPYNNSRLDPVWASLAMALSSVSVICSSLLLRLYRPPKVQFDAEVGDEGESIKSVHTNRKWKRRLAKIKNVKKLKNAGKRLETIEVVEE
ncbi:YALI0B02684p [Yarrowia lipolytica CLIB122]|jgi:Cu+-exporting ATPase|uniref:YALI0B02684p n=2 Tax=Yarrowia lipolytica TaxID=4952 RepID=Q6CFX9_YARLI|nr:YALI0B02684p [Yarrowia lipolytica CLIB122]AOW01133.1 hypothetical protein YALI1_B04068g [Yarrowia lipolytica]KAB8285246.1 E1-E2 ATPase-domain-containing protein [Yarrowia lipolytica]KAE8174870.1 E1-E2 ATPase-domain-containing protein [Yarrowia lipolytica]KAJ8052026.1 E1-E2 ATPase-domain-containing protein [Yarrowia lipolytica]RDW24130.1 E1-E2 ATPase-domain-containing protein [Yarrowia lipolytica]|eukprot:XP_500433.1 YALI0B02684p [Yarrowia lipolytica CLIB122]